MQTQAILHICKCMYIQFLHIAFARFPVRSLDIFAQTNLRSCKK